jgi:DNA modification methylase
MANCIVLDPFGGSGSTLIACEQTNRICFMVELDEKYCDVIVRRFCQNHPDQPIYWNGERIQNEDIIGNTDIA